MSSSGSSRIGSHPLGFRVAGTPEERAATAFIASEMRDAGLVDVVEEPVPVDAWRLEDAYVELDDGVRFECASFGGVPETPAGGIAAELVVVGRGGRRQLDRLDVGGKVALVALGGRAALAVPRRPGARPARRCRNDRDVSARRPVLPGA